MSPVVESKQLPGDDVVGGSVGSVGTSQGQPAVAPTPYTDESPQSDSIPASSAAAQLLNLPASSASVVTPTTQDQQVKSLCACNLVHLDIGIFFSAWNVLGEDISSAFSGRWI